MAMGQEHMGGALSRIGRIALEQRIPGEKRIDHEDRFAGLDAKGGMAEITDLHGAPPWLG